MLKKLFVIVLIILVLVILIVVFVKDSLLDCIN